MAGDEQVKTMPGEPMMGQLNYVDIAGAMPAYTTYRPSLTETVLADAARQVADRWGADCVALLVVLHAAHDHFHAARGDRECGPRCKARAALKVLTP